MAADRTDLPLPLPPAGQGFYARLESRVGTRALARRLALQVEMSAEWLGGRGRHRLHLENFQPLHAGLRAFLWVTGLRDRARRNTLDYRVTRNRVALPGLHPDLDGLRILHLSDLHADAMVDNGARLARVLEGITADAAVITGDFRFAMHGAWEEPGRIAARLAASLNCPDGVYAVAGNHDFLEMLPLLEDAGVRMLYNEGAVLEHGAGRLWLAGVDDPHFYACHDPAAAMAGRPADVPALFLCHSPEAAAEACALGADLFLCGHTHGGQICLPGAVPLITNAAAPRSRARGAWTLEGMRGYTSRGTGCSSCQARLNCPPEIAVHTLARGEEP
jgi:predicted MPP superfamily phosphohydrolase